jgi:CheY-like chemotaxis protein
MESTDRAAKILVVDDDLQALGAMERVLRTQGFAVSTFSDARAALAAAAAAPPDLILLDITMPDMDGYAACRHFKANPMLFEVPVVFISALGEIDDKVRGFAAGAVDYVTKPFDYAEVQARVETQVRLRRLQLAEHELLEKTLGGAVKALVEIVVLASPTVSERGRSVRAIVTHLVDRLQPPGRWQYELAASLCPIGCIAIPEEVLEKAYAGVPMADEERQMFLAHPALARRILGGIPRLEAVAEIIGRQLETSLPASLPETVSTGLALLRLAQEFDQLTYRGVDPAGARASLKISTMKHDPRLITALADYTAARSAPVTRFVQLAELKPRMILDEDLTTAEGTLLARRGMEMSLPLIARLRNFGDGRNASRSIRVLVPAPGPGGEADSERRAAA